MVRAGDLKVISTPVDVLAVNYYTPVVVDGDRRPVERYETAHPADWLQIYPQGLYDVLTRVARDHGKDLPLMITECGRPTETDRSGDGTGRTTTPTASPSCGTTSSKRTARSRPV